MRFQRGIADMWLVVVSLIVLGGLTIGVMRWLQGFEDRGYQRGVNEAAATYAQRDNDALRAATAQIQALQSAVRAAERQAAEKIAQIDKKRQQEIQNAKLQANRDIVAVRAGTLILRDPGQAAECAAPGDTGAGATVAAAAGERDGATPRELSRAAAEFLLSLAGEADDVTRQLANAQAVIVQDRMTCHAN